jgi:hypothetical protein
MTKVARRHVFYIPGFDPVPPRAYRERYRREAARQAALSGYEIAKGKAPDGAQFGWGVIARIEGQEVTTGFEVLHWADIVQAGMKGGILATYLGLLRTAATYIGSGADERQPSWPRTSTKMAGGPRRREGVARP